MDIILSRMHVVSRIFINIMEHRFIHTFDNAISKALKYAMAEQVHAPPKRDILLL